MKCKVGRVLKVSVLVLALMACRSGGGDSEAGPSTIDSAAAEGAGGSGQASSSQDEAPELTDEVGVFDDLTVESCETTPGEVKANGTVVNSSDDQADFVLLVRWVEREGSRVLDRATVVIEDLDADATHEWEAEGEVPDGADAVCSYSVKRGQLG